MLLVQFEMRLKGWHAITHTFVRRGIGALVLLAGMGQAVMAAPVGMASYLAGKPEVQHGGGAWQPMRLLQRLEPGDTVRCGADTEAVIVLFVNGSRYRIGAHKQGTIGAMQVRGADALVGLRTPTLQVAKAMIGSQSNAFLARAASQSHEFLTPTSTGWFVEGTRQFVWSPIDGSASYTFTLFDRNDNVIWSVRTTDPNAEYPGDLTPLNLKRPYVWRLTGFGESGKPMAASRWGIITFLSQSDADQMTKDAKALQAQIDASPKDTTLLVLLSELYRQYGVLEKTLDILEDQKLSSQPGIDQAQIDIYKQVSPYALALSKYGAKMTPSH